MHVHLEEIDGGSEDDGERAGPDGKIDVFLVKESFGTISDFGSDKFKGVHDISGRCLFGSSGNGDLFVSLSVLENASFDGSVIVHVDSLDEKSGKSSPEGGENSGAEDAEWSNSVLEIVLGLSVLNTVVVSPFSWFSRVSEQGSWENQVEIGRILESKIHSFI